MHNLPIFASLSLAASFFLLHLSIQLLCFFLVNHGPVTAAMSSYNWLQACSGASRYWYCLANSTKWNRSASIETVHKAASAIKWIQPQGINHLCTEVIKEQEI